MDEVLWDSESKKVENRNLSEFRAAKQAAIASDKNGGVPAPWHGARPFSASMLAVGVE